MKHDGRQACGLDFLGLTGLFGGKSSQGRIAAAQVDDDILLGRDACSISSYSQVTTPDALSVFF